MPIPDIQIKQLTVGRMAENCYLLFDQDTLETIIIDPGDDGQYLIEQIQRLNGRPSKILATHGHFDHLLAVTELQLTYGIPFHIHKSDEFLLSRMRESVKYFLNLDYQEPLPKVSNYLEPDQLIPFSDHTLQVIYTPGHTPGSVSFFLVEAQALFVGDVMFASGGRGRTDFQYSDASKLKASITTLLKYQDEIRIYPGHGPITTVGKEK